MEVVTDGIRRIYWGESPHRVSRWAFIPAETFVNRARGFIYESEDALDEDLLVMDMLHERLWKLEFVQRKRQEQKRIRDRQVPGAEFAQLAYVTYCYGGHEEGGWYYPAYIPVEGADPILLLAGEPTTGRARKIAELQARKLGLAAKWAGGPPMGGCGDNPDGDDLGGDYELTIVWSEGEPFDFEHQRRPRYE